MRKFMSEFAVNMVGGPAALIQQEDLDSSEVENMFSENPCHIYMICRRPRMYIEPQDTNFTYDKFEGNVTILDGPRLIKEPFSMLTNDSDGFKYVSDYPYNSFVIHDEDGAIKLVGKTASLVCRLGYEIQKHLVYEVLYVGQSYGSDGNRVAPDRLASHSTLQRIYADAQSRTPDKEIWIILWSFSPLLITSIDGRSKEFEMSNDEDSEHIDQVLSTEITEEQKINFTEAALIKYFQPEYNTIYKDSFPTPIHSSYSECYDLDINSIIVEIDTSYLYCKLWSRAVKSDFHHIVSYPLHSREEREAMFDFVSLNEES